jgi:tetratricopeptide (TPR) repeat protein
MRLIYRLLAALILVGGSAAAWFLPAAGASRFGADLKSGSSIQRRQAIAFHERRLEEDPQSALDMAQLAALLLDEGRMRGNDDALAQAEALARKSLGQRARRNGRSAALLVNALVAQHRFTEAVKVARDLVNFDPETPAYRALLAEVLMEVGDYREAITQLGSVRLHREDLAIAPRFARWAELTGQPGEARRILTAARDEAHQREDLGGEQKAWYDLRLADVELRHGNLRTASSAIRSGLKQSPGDWRLLLARARVEAAEGSWRKAIESAETVIADVPTPDALALLATAHTVLGHREEAGAYIVALDAISQRQDGEIHRAWAFTMLDRDSTAANVVERAAADTLVRRDIHTLDFLAWALHKAGRSKEALLISRRATAMGNVEPALRFRAGMIELAAGDPALARVHLEVAMQGERALTTEQLTEARQAVDALSSRLVP